jgi:hypothetical protein
MSYLVSPLAFKSLSANLLAIEDRERAPLKMTDCKLVDCDCGTVLIFVSCVLKISKLRDVTQISPKLKSAFNERNMILLNVRVSKVTSPPSP